MLGSITHIVGEKFTFECSRSILLLNLNFDGALLFYVFISFNLAPAVRREDGTEFKVLYLKAIRAAVNRYLG